MDHDIKNLNNDHSESYSDLELTMKVNNSITQIKIIISS